MVVEFSRKLQKSQNGNEREQESFLEKFSTESLSKFRFFISTSDEVNFISTFATFCFANEIYNSLFVACRSTKAQSPPFVHFFDAPSRKECIALFESDYSPSVRHSESVSWNDLLWSYVLYLDNTSFSLEQDLDSMSLEDKKPKTMQKFNSPGEKIICDSCHDLVHSVRETVDILCCGHMFHSDCTFFPSNSSEPSCTICHPPPKPILAHPKPFQSEEPLEAGKKAKRDVVAKLKAKSKQKSLEEEESKEKLSKYRNQKKATKQTTEEPKPRRSSRKKNAPKVYPQ